MISPAPVFRRFLTLVLLLASAVPAVATGGVDDLVKGPSVGKLLDVATVRVDDGFIFCGAKGTRKIMEMMGNRVDGSEAGFLAPADYFDEKPAGPRWFVLFDWNDGGYVSDADKDEIDADAILENYRAGTEAANEERRRRGEPTLSITGWFEKPRYDERSHHLVWAMEAVSSDGGKVVNYNTRLLGRHGYMSAVVVADPGDLAGLKPAIAKMLGGFSYVPGKDYASFVKGDRVAEVGLAALVAGGIGVAAAKMGILQILLKNLKAVLLAILAFFNKMKRMLGMGGDDKRRR